MVSGLFIFNSLGRLRFSSEYLYAMTFIRPALLLISILFTACISPSHLDKIESASTPERCLVRRAAMDIGSGSTKIKVADVDICREKTLSILFNGQTPLALKENIKQGSFSPEFIKTASEQILKLAKEATKHDVPLNKIAAVGTQALREAGNSQDLVNELKRSQLQLRLITQGEEAELGHRAAVSDSDIDAKEVTSFDIGGGSFQIVSLSPKTDVIGGHLASVSFKDHIVERIQRRPPNASPNPIKEDDAKRAIGFAEQYARDLKRKNPKFVFQKTIVGVGGVFGFSVAGQLGKTRFKASDLEEAYPKLISRRSDEIRGDFRDTESTNLLLVLGLLRGFGLENHEILVKKANLSDGILTNSAYY